MEKVVMADDVKQKKKNEFKELILNFENLFERNDINLMMDLLDTYFKDFKNKDDYMQKTHDIVKKYKTKYSRELSPEIKHQVYLYSQQPRENRKDLIEINPKILEALRIILYEKFTNLMVRYFQDFDPLNINANSVITEETKIPQKIKREDIYKLINELKVAVPNRLLCPISREIMEDPVCCPLGYTYDRKNIVNWFKTSDITPLTGEKLYIKSVTPNHLCKSDLSEFLQKIEEKKKKNNKRKFEEDDSINQISNKNSKIDTKTVVNIINEPKN